MAGHFVRVFFKIVEFPLLARWHVAAVKTNQLETFSRDAFVSTLLALDYEKDDYNTPRIAAAVTRGSGSGVLGVVREDGVEVRRFELAPGECFFVSTYETNRVSASHRGDFDAASAQEGAEFILRRGVFAEMTNPVTGVCALESEGGFEIALAQA